MTNRLLSIRAASMSSNLVMAMAILSSAAVSTTAWAQTAPAAAPAAEEVEPEGEILVTARRKSENILTTPIAISALTSQDIAARGIATLQDIGNFVPGLNVIGQATTGGRADRSFVGIVLRGMVPSTSLAQTTSIFIDGSPISTATALQTLNNPERVEVIKGPQSALFGRQTFAGALNVVTKAPSDHLSGSVSGMAGTRSNYDVAGEISAPIITDVLSFRASARAMGKHGSYENYGTPGQTLGDQSTKTGSLAVVFKPTPNLTIKGFGLYTKLKDGPSAQGLISAYGIKNPAGQTLVADQSNCNITSSAGVVNRYICGVAPGLSGLTPSSNSANNATIVNLLSNPSGRIVSPKNGVHGYGLVNRYYHVHLNADWKIGDSGVTLSSLTGWNKEIKSELADLDNFNSTTIPTTTVPANPEGYYNFPYMLEGVARDFSQEVRASFENGGPLHGTFGGSYLTATNQNSAGGPTIGGSRISGATNNRTYGVFGAVGYDFSRRFSLNFDARYQIDKLSAYAGQGGVVATTNVFVPVGTYPENGKLVGKTYKTFLPRVIAQYNFDTGMVYASYSKGVNPGTFNTLFITALPAAVAAAESQGYKVVVDPEKVANYEIGAKGKLFDNRVRYDAAAFMAIWTNQIQLQTLLVPRPNLAPLQVSASANSGSVKIRGIEAHISADLVQGLSVDLAGAFTDTYILKGANGTVTAATGITNFRGNENPFTPKWSGTVALDYTHPVGTGDLNAFSRVDFTYKTGSYADISNLVRSPDMNQVNLRLGVRSKTFSIEGFATNLFNNQAYYTIASTKTVLQTGVGGSLNALIAQLREKRTLGLRGTFNF